jgi:transposase InsO family protein
MGAEESAPRGRALATGWDAFRFQDARDRGSRDAMAHVLQRPLNARIAPARILHCHPHRQAPNLGEHARSPRSPPPVGPFPRNQVAMPSKDGVGGDERRHVLQYGASEPLPEHRETPALSIRQPQPAAGQLRFQGAIFLAQERDHITLLSFEPSEQRGEQHLKRNHASTLRELEPVRVFGQYAHGMPPVPKRPTSWHTFLRAHWGTIAGADFFTTEVWTWRGLVTYYTVFVIDLASRRVQIVGSTPHPHEMFMQQVVRTMTAADDGFLIQHRVLICDRDTKWSAPVRARLSEAGVRVVQTPYRAPNANAYAERFVRSIKQECLDRVIPFGACHLRQTIAAYVEHYHRERNHQGLDNALIDDRARRPMGIRIRRRPRLGGLLNYYERAA